VESSLLPGASALRIPFAIGSDGLLGMALGVGISAIVRIFDARGDSERPGHRLGAIAGALLGSVLAIALGLFANRVVLRGAHFLDARSLALDAAALALAILFGVVVARRISRASFSGGLPRALRASAAAAMAILFAGGALLPRLAVPRASPDLSRPPIVLVSIDTLRPDRLSAGGEARPTSPELDRFLREGTHFVNATTPSPGSAPSHASLFTSRSPVSHGVFTNFTILHDEVETLAELLADDGYETAGFATNTFLGRRFGFDQGFDHYVESGVVERARRPSPAVFARSLAVFQLLDRARSRIQPGYDPSFETMLQFLEESSGPLFLFVHVMDVHSPYAPPDPWGARFGARREGTRDTADSSAARRKKNRFGWRPSEEAYVAEVRYADHKMGRLRRTLEREGLLDRAVLVLSSDHGENLLDHEPNFSHGRTLYDATLRILLAMRGPAVERGRLVEDLTENVDVVPAIAAARGAPARAIWEGRAPRTSPGSSDAARAFSYAQLMRDFAIRSRHEKILLPEAGAAVRFDLDEDPGETTPLSPAADQEAAARHELSAWIERTATPLYTSSPKAVAPGELSRETLEKLRTLGYVE
jgi:arylsulfatase A-like enzyme